ncbi:proline dehydrogenase, partial [Bacillus sp. SIMBA_005]
MLRSICLFLSKNKMLTKFAQAYGIRFGAGRFVA